MERELSEMYGIFFLYSNDSRKLLLNYSDNFFPLKKNYFLIKKKNTLFNFKYKNINNDKNVIFEL